MDKQGQFFYVSPLNFDMKEYKNVLGTTKKNTQRFSEDLPYNIPIYRRKPYEIKNVEISDKYYPYEMEDTRLY